MFQGLFAFLFFGRRRSNLQSLDDANRNDVAVSRGMEWNRYLHPLVVSVGRFRQGRGTIRRDIYGYVRIQIKKFLALPPAIGFPSLREVLARVKRKTRVARSCTRTHLRQFDDWTPEASEDHSPTMHECECALSLLDISPPSTLKLQGPTPPPTAYSSCPTIGTKVFVIKHEWSSIRASV